MRITDRCGVYLAVVFALSTGGMAAQPVFAAEPFAPPEESLRHQVWEFERSLSPLPVAERADRARRYFAELKDAGARIAAMDMLDNRYVYVVPKSIMPEILAPLLRDPDQRVRSRAARAVAYNGLGSQHADALLALLKEGVAETKSVVLHAMGSSRDERFLPAIRSELTNPDAQVRIAAAFSFQRLQPATRELDPLLADADPLVRAAVVQILPDAPGAPRLLTDPAPAVRERAARALGDGGERAQAAAIARLLHDEDPHVRAAAAYALGRLQAAAYGIQIEALLQKDEDVVVRRYAAGALADLRRERHLPALRAALADEDLQVRNTAAKAIRLTEEPQLNPDSLR